METLSPDTVAFEAPWYTNCKIQPIEYAEANGLGLHEHAIVKYVSRHQDKGGAKDILELIWYALRILKMRYGLDYLPPQRVAG